MIIVICVLINYLINVILNSYRDHVRGHYQGGRSRGGFRSRGRGRGGLGFGSHGGGGSKFAKSYSEEVREQVDELYKKKYVTIATIETFIFYSGTNDSFSEARTFSGVCGGGGGGGDLSVNMVSV